MRNLLITLCLLFGISANAELIRPQTVQQFKKTSVRVYSTTIRSGGTGSILYSSSLYSIILTNRHICRIIEQGGIVEQNGKKYDIVRYKKYDKHDLCLLKVLGDLEVSTRVAKRAPKASSKTYVSGHPHLLPHIVNSGHASEQMTIRLMWGAVKCTEEDLKDKNKAMECMFFGNLAIFKDFKSTVVSNLIQPGNSGSAVFNSYGEIIGVAFAGSGDLSYGFIVPHAYLVDFLTNKSLKWINVGEEVDNEGLDERFFNFGQCKKVFNGDICKTAYTNMAWGN